MKRRGFTLVELVLAMFVMGWVIVGTFAVFNMTLNSYHGTRTDIELTDEGALGIRGVADTLAGAYSVAVVNNGLTVQYTMPLLNTVLDTETLEYELFYPLQSDGVVKSFTIANGELVRVQDGHVIAENVVLTDPDPASLGYNLAYAPFELTTVGTKTALKINLITEVTANGKARYVRMRTTVLIRNSS